MKTVTIVGCGFLGGIFAEEICKRAYAFEEALTLYLFDPDLVSARNAANQLWHPGEEGSAKVTVLAKRLAPYGVTLFPRVERIEKGDEDDLEGDVLVCSVDNIPSRLLLWEIAVSKGIPLLTMGISQGGTGGVEWTDGDIDTNPFSAIRLAGRSKKELEGLGRVEELPPCELVGFRGLGLNTALAAAKALWIFLGFDPEKEALPETPGEPGKHTAWDSTNRNHTLREVL